MERPELSAQVSRGITRRIFKRDFHSDSSRGGVRIVEANLVELAVLCWNI
jgi:hypothetical protein